MKNEQAEEKQGVSLDFVCPKAYIGCIIKHKK